MPFSWPLERHRDLIKTADLFLVKTFRSDWSGSRLLTLWMLSQDMNMRPSMISLTILRQRIPFIPNMSTSAPILDLAGFVQLALFVVMCNLLAFLLRFIELGQYISGAQTRMGDYFLLLWLRTCLALPEELDESRWLQFWIVYFLCTTDLASFESDYMESWRLYCAELDQDGQERIAMLFISGMSPIGIPCARVMDDEALMKQVIRSYYLSSAKQGWFDVFSLKSVQRIDVVKVEQHRAEGRIGRPLPLGKSNMYGRNSSGFEDPANLKGRREIIDRLLDEGVIIAQPATSSTPLALQTSPSRALNAVRGWDISGTKGIVLLPLLASALVAIVWPIVATRAYHADVQASVQTSFTVASYMVTTGALFIALVAFLDTKSDREEEWPNAASPAAASPPVPVVQNALPMTPSATMSEPGSMPTQQPNLTSVP